MILLSLFHAYADDDEHETRRVSRTPPDPVYQKECGACHVAYPASMLPARSWAAILGGLGDHFGDDASLGSSEKAAIATWLFANAGDRVGSRAVARIPQEQVPLRITGLGWFVHEHGEIPESWVKASTDVRSFANCGACHTRAGEGLYGESGIRLPGGVRFEEDDD